MKYKNALIVGRFNTFHKGHESLVEKALEIAENVHIFVGSAQEQGTLRNPLPAVLRRFLINEIYKEQKNIKIYELNDLTNENDITPEWGKYLIKTVTKKIGKKPDLMIFGNDESRNNWFAEEDNLPSVVLSREEIPISATQIREAIKIGNKEVFFENTNTKIHKHYDLLNFILGV